MNTADSEIVASILQSAGYVRCESVDAAQVILVNTCAVRENAEQKVWQRLTEFRTLKKARAAANKASGRADPLPLVGVLGCMAERLKTALLEVRQNHSPNSAPGAANLSRLYVSSRALTPPVPSPSPHTLRAQSDKMVDAVVGPDAYRDLPRLLASLDDGGAAAVNVLLSLDETYADVAPVRDANNTVSAFVSIMRGCNNMCSYCIVPFTRGKERSRYARTSCQQVVLDLL